MDKKLDCDIVKDLLPNYIEKMTSNTTDQNIMEHLATCDDCNTVYFQMKENVPTEVAPETKQLKKYLNKTKYAYAATGLFAIGIIGILVSIIVNLAVNGCLSWSLIVTGGIAYAYSIGYTFIRSSKRRFIKTLVCITVWLVPYLALIQFVTHKYFNAGVWLFKIGIPISLIWLAIVWLVILIQRLYKLNFFISLSVLMFFSIVGQYFTNVIAGSYDNFGDYISNFVANSLGNSITAVVFLILGMYMGVKKKR